MAEVQVLVLEQKLEEAEQAASSQGGVAEVQVLVLVLVLALQHE